MPADTDRYIVTVLKVPPDERTLFSSLPEEQQNSYEDVHPGVEGHEVSYSIDLTEEQAERARQADNLMDLLRISDYGLGALQYHSLEETDHPASAALQALPEVSLPESRYWARGPILNQGREGACAGFSARAFLNAEPIMTEPASGPSARQIYLEAQRVDEWAGENYSGTSVNAACRILRSYGYVDRWYWAQTLEEIRDWLLHRGGILFTLDWYEGCYRTNRYNYISASGRLVGLHAIFARGIYFGDRYLSIRLQNSWGTWYGVDGEAWVWEPDLVNIFMRSSRFGAICPVQVR